MDCSEPGCTCEDPQISLSDHIELFNHDPLLLGAFMKYDDELDRIAQAINKEYFEKTTGELFTMPNLRMHKTIDIFHTYMYGFPASVDNQKLPTADTMWDTLRETRSEMINDFIKNPNPPVDIAKYDKCIKIIKEVQSATGYPTEQPMSKESLENLVKRLKSYDLYEKNTELIKAINEELSHSMNHETVRLLEEVKKLLRQHKSQNRLPHQHKSRGINKHTHEHPHGRGRHHGR